MVLLLLFNSISFSLVYGENLNNNQNLNLLVEKSDFNELEYVLGELIVKFDSKVSINVNEDLSIGIPTIDLLNKEFGINNVKKILHENINTLTSNLYKFEFSKDIDIQNIANQYNKNQAVIYAEPNYLFQTCKTPNDPYFSNQWALNQLNKYDIHAPDAWDIETGSSDTVVAIIDTGVDYNHIDIIDNIWHDQNGNPGHDFVDINVNAYLPPEYELYPDEDYVESDGDPLDVLGHGTHCAGIVGAVGNNNIGITGVSWQCKIMPVKAGFKIKFLSNLAGKFETDDIINAIHYAADNGADIISFSFGRYGEVKSIEDACNYAYNKGVLLIASAGNENCEAFHIPSSYENVISVGATDEYDKKASFSNYGQYVDIAAPGVNILSLRAKDTDMYDDGGSHIINKDYYIASGTSMSCPIVSGIATLILSKNSSLSNRQIKDILINSVDKITPCANLGKGRINAYEALLRDSNQVNIIISNPLHGIETDNDIEINGNASCSSFQRFVIDYAKGISPLYNDYIEICSSSSQVQNGKLATFPVSQLDDGLYTIRLKVITNNGIYFDKIWIIINKQNNDIIIDNSNINGPWTGSEDNPYQYIQDGIDSAGIGDTVYVNSGIYESDLIIDRIISLKGKEKTSTIISGEISVVNINGIEISNFTLTGENDNDRISAIYLKNSNNNHIFNNIFMKYSNGWGINIRESSDNTIIDNTIKDNSMGILATSSFNNKIYHNNFLNNENHVYDNGINQWDDGNQGNYWDDYKEKYPDGKPNLDLKTWDKPYKINGGENFDNFPCINPDGRNKVRSYQLNFFSTIINLFKMIVSSSPRL